MLLRLSSATAIGTAAKSGLQYSVLIELRVQISQSEHSMLALHSLSISTFLHACRDCAGVAHACIHPFTLSDSCIDLSVGSLCLFCCSLPNTCSRLMGQQIRQSAAGIAWLPRKSQPLRLPAPVSPLSLAPTASCLALHTHLRTLLHLLQMQKQRRMKQTTFPGTHNKRHLIRPHRMSRCHLIMHNA